MRARQRHILIGVTTAVALVAVGVSSLIYYRANTPTTTRGATGTGGAKTATGLDQPPSSAPSSAPVVTSSPSPAVSPSLIKPVISTLPSVSNGLLRLRAYAEGQSSGQCQLILSRTGSAPVTYAAQLSSQGICQGFDIDVSGFSKDAWTAQVRVSSPFAEGISDAAGFSIN